MKKYTISLLFLVISFSAYAQNQEVGYSFFVAGHVYGQPGERNGLHPPFREKFNYLQSRPELQFGVFTGDIVPPNPTAADWDKVDTDIANLGLPVYFTVGNHDMEDRQLFEDRYGETYYSFKHANDLFIILDPNLDGWNISGEQLNFLKNTLTQNKNTSNNIFVFFHQLLWWKNNSIYTPYRPNSFEGKADSINFWSEIEPLFSELPNQVYMFAGDVGAGSWAADFMYDKYKNISLIASGMGEGPGDNFVVTSVYENDSVGYDLICLSDTVIQCFGNLTDYRLTTGTSMHPDNRETITVYPNPATHEFHVLVKSAKEKVINIHLFGLTGKKILSRQFRTNAATEIRTEANNGLYFYKIESNGVVLKAGKLLINNR